MRPFARFGLALTLAAGTAAAGLGPARGESAPTPSTAQTVVLRTSDGVSLVATLHPTSRTPAPAVALVHMQTRSRTDWSELVERLVDAGIAALAFDLRGHGASASGSTGPGAAANMSPSLLDVKAAHAFLSTRTDVAPGRVAFVGASVGANLALAAAAAEPAIRGVVLLSAGIDYRGIRGDAAIRKYGRRPALIIASLDDPYATRSAREFAKLGEGAYELRLLNSAGHGTVMLAREPDLYATIVDWLRRTLI